MTYSKRSLRRRCSVCEKKLPAIMHGLPAAERLCAEHMPLWWRIAALLTGG
jgi:hypothetical protein